ncbi:ribonuclease T2 family protein [Musicola keenii]|uniref:ribonuclease T2 family protein n=1 Tax=Musicola keenii TaxID=2884250 RepID=UPI00177F1000|nr:ribonuclease T2 [Musicola keenii]
MSKGFALLAGLALAGSLLSAPSLAQNKNQAGMFDYYLLTLSWSPTFCLTHKDNPQCTKGYGFVLHGLWPQYTKGGWPENCPPIAALTPEERRQGDMIFPSDDLLTHEWEKHGTCSGLGAKGYLEAADQALSQVKVPPELQAPHKPLFLSADKILTAFRQSNPDIPADGLVVACNKKELSEVRVCLDKQLKFQSCASNIKSNCPAGEIRIPNVR